MDHPDHPAHQARLELLERKEALVPLAVLVKMAAPVLLAQLVRLARKERTASPARLETKAVMRLEAAKAMLERLVPEETRERLAVTATQALLAMLVLQEATDHPDLLEAQAAMETKDPPAHLDQLVARAQMPSIVLALVDRPSTNHKMANNTTRLRSGRTLDDPFSHFHSFPMFLLLQFKM